MLKKLFFIASAALILFTTFIPIVHLRAQNPYGRPSRKTRGRFETMRGTVEVFSSRAITIRDAKQMYLVRTFSFDPKLLPKMQRRHYAKGDRVKIKYIRGTDIAVSVN